MGVIMWHSLSARPWLLLISSLRAKCLPLDHLTWQAYSPVLCFALSVRWLSLVCLSISLSSQEAGAEWGHQREAPITGSPSPPPGTGLQVQDQTPSLGGSRLKKKTTWLQARVSRKEKREENRKWGCNGFLLFFPFVLEHFISSLSFRFCFY